jgi:hypothetical protein
MYVVRSFSGATVTGCSCRRRGYARRRYLLYGDDDIKELWWERRTEPPQGHCSGGVKAAPGAPSGLAAAAAALVDSGLLEF